MEPQSEQEEMIRSLAKASENTFWGYLGCKFVRLQHDQVVIELDAEARHLNMIGIVHGGVLSALLDNAMGIIVMAARPQNKTVTTNLNVHFVSPLQQGRLTVTAEIVHMSRKLATAQGRITDEEGHLGTIGTGTFRVI